MPRHRLAPYHPRHSTHRLSGLSTPPLNTLCITNTPDEGVACPPPVSLHLLSSATLRAQHTPDEVAELLPPSLCIQPPLPPRFIPKTAQTRRRNTHRPSSCFYNSSTFCTKNAREQTLQLPPPLWPHAHPHLDPSTQKVPHTAIWHFHNPTSALFAQTTAPMMPLNARCPSYTLTHPFAQCTPGSQLPDPPFAHIAASDPLQTRSRTGRPMDRPLPVS